MVHDGKEGTVTRVYIAGPMSGYEDYNYPAFHAMARRLRALGFEVESPAENPEQECWEDYLKVALRQMLTCDSVVFLKGWEASKGATLEHHVAMSTGLGILTEAHVKMLEMGTTVQRASAAWRGAFTTSEQVARSLTNAAIQLRSKIEVPLHERELCDEESDGEAVGSCGGCMCPCDSACTCEAG